MAVMAGKDGLIKIGEKIVGYIDNYSLNINQGSAETSQIGKPWRDYIPTASDWSGSFSGTLDHADEGQLIMIGDILAPAGEPLVLELKVSPTLTLTGAIIVTSGAITGSYSDKVAISYNFQGTGALTEKETA